MPGVEATPTAIAADGLWKTGVSGATTHTQPDRLGEFLQQHGSSTGIGFLATLSMLCLVGVVGNSVALSIFCSRLKNISHLTYRNHYNFFTCALAASDLLVCAWRLPMEFFIAFRLITNDAVCKAMGGLSQASVVFSSLIHVGLCVERYYAVCKPRSPFSVHKLKLVVGAFGAISFILSTPSLWIYSAYSHSGEADRLGCHRRHEIPVGWYYNLTLAILMSMSVIAVLSLYGVMFRVVLTKVLKKTAGPASEPRTAQSIIVEDSLAAVKSPEGCCCSPFRWKLGSAARIALMFFPITIIFYVSWLPYFMVNLDVTKCNIILENAHFVTSCTSFIAYVAFNRRIRKEAAAKLSLKKPAGPGRAASLDELGTSSSSEEASQERAVNKAASYKPRFQKRMQK